MPEPDLCTAIKGRRVGQDCEIDSSHPITKQCTAVGGKLADGKCVISEERLRQLIK